MASAQVHIAVIGGGITGQLIQLQIPEAVIYDWQPRPRTMYPLTRNFGGNYLWKPIPGLPCRKFPVVTHIDGAPATPATILAYKHKIGKEGEESVINNWKTQFQPHMTGYDFLQLPEPRVEYDHRIVSIDYFLNTILFASGLLVSYDYLLSTIPLYSLLSMVGTTALREVGNSLRFKPIYVRVVKSPPDRRYSEDTFYVNYLSEPDVAAYRFTDRNAERHYESIIPMQGHETRCIKPGKIYDNPDVYGVLDHLERRNIFTFGRYGSWASDELVHETWEKIEEWRLGVHDG